MDGYDDALREHDGEHDGVLDEHDNRAYDDAFNHLLLFFLFYTPYAFKKKHETLNK